MAAGLVRLRLWSGSWGQTPPIGCETALLRAVLMAAGHQVIYVPGRRVKSMSGAFAWEAKTAPLRSPMEDQGGLDR